MVKKGMNKRNFILALAVILAILTASVFLTSCKKPKEEGVKTWLNSFAPIEKPVGLQDYELDIEWATELKPDRPIAIIFNGYKEYDQKEALGLDRKAYVQDGQDKIFSVNAKNILENELKPGMEGPISLAKYWEEAGFSVGIFHYERFADKLNEKGEILDFSYKIFDRTKNEYKVKAGDKEGIKTASFNLLEAFVTAYNKRVIETKLSTSSPSNRPFEVRFIGHKGGANFAVAASDYLYELNKSLPENQKIDRYLPNRLALLNPYWSNTRVTDINIDYIDENNEFGMSKKMTSLLTYNQKAIPRLSEYGVVFEVYQSNQNHFLSYDEIYHGVDTVTEEGSSIPKYEWKEGTDTNAYDAIIKQVAYMNFRETITDTYFRSEVSGNYSKYDRIALDWYLYSIMGSDTNNSSYKLDVGGEKPTFDTIDYDMFNKESSIKYGMSAWTSTVYLKAMQGHIYNMQKYTKPSNIQDSGYTDWSMSEFSSNIYQSSDFSLDEGDFYVCGYVYETYENSRYVNLASNARIKNATVRMTVTQSDMSDAKPDYFEAKTDETGFYKIALKQDYLQRKNLSNSYDVRLTIHLEPSQAGYKQYINYSLTAGEKIYNLIDIASIHRPTNDSDDDKYRLGVDEKHKYFIIFKNCGLVRDTE